MTLSVLPPPALEKVYRTELAGELPAAQRVSLPRQICRHPAVLECAVIAIPDERWGERPKARS